MKKDLISSVEFGNTNAFGGTIRLKWLPNMNRRIAKHFPINGKNKRVATEGNKRHILKLKNKTKRWCCPNSRGFVLS